MKDNESYVESLFLLKVLDNEFIIDNTLKT